MKKILLGTTALVSAGLVAGPALAGDPLSVSVSGSVVTGFYVVDADDAVGGTGYQDTKVALVARNIDIIAEGTLDNGMTAGVDAKLMLGSDWNTIHNVASPSGVTFRQLFAYLEGGFGRFEIGGVDGAAYKMHYTSPWFVPGNGVDSPNIYNGVTSTGGSASTRLSTFSLMATDANKVTYFTPRFAGFQLGASYTPDVTQSTTGPRASGRGVLPALTGGAGVGPVTDVFEIAANYAGTIGGLDVGVDGFYVDGDGNATNADPKEYGFGASLGYMGFTLGGAWYQNEDIAGPTNYGAFTPSASLSDAGSEIQTWTVGVSYGTGPWTVGVAYIESQDDSSATSAFGSNGAETQAWQVGGGYSLGSGVDLGLDVQFTSDKSAAGAPTYDSTSGGLVLAVSF
ncbi:putative porin [Parvibaculum indicum]|uniref:porin n=1 Tax=Parvibaculum indicum TaxID=562969 RepID=UPI00142176BA|nr:porin [Parvibaculum indicum]NIJ43303.1 putative porin [Parvibaculum indicum]